MTAFRAVTAEKCTKKNDARAELLFCHSKPVAYLSFSLTSPSSVLKLPDGCYKDAQGNGLKFVPKSCPIVQFDTLAQRQNS